MSKHPLVLAGCLVMSVAPVAAVTPLAPGAGPIRLSAQSAVQVLSTEAAPRRDTLPGPAGFADPAAFDQAALTSARALKSVSGSKPWQQVGKGGAIVEVPAQGGLAEGRLRTTGIVLDLAVDPADATGATAFVGTGGGLWKTTDAGASWTRAEGIPASSVGAVGVSPQDSRDVYAVTGQAFQSGDPGGSGVYVSHDGGVTFTRPSSNVRGAGGQHVDVGADGVVFAATSGGLFRSVDKGSTWQDVLLPTNKTATAPAANTPVGSWTTDVRVRPGTPGEVFAAVGYVAGNVKLPDGTQAAPGNGLYKSAANGAPGTWQRVTGADSSTTGWRSNPTVSTDPIGRTELAFSADGSVLWALVADAARRGGGYPGDAAIPAGAGGALPVHPDSLNGLYRSDATTGTLGESWVLKATSQSLTASPGGVQPVLSAANLVGYNTGIQAWYNGYIAVDPTDANRLILGEEEVYQSLDANSPAPGLGTFQAIDEYFALCASADPQTNGVPCAASGLNATHPDQHGVAFSPLPGGSRLWIGNDGGVFRQDAGPTGFRLGGWTSGASYNTLLPYKAAKSTVGGKSLVVAGLQDNGTVLWRDGSKDSFPFCGGDGSIAAISPTNLDTIYCNVNGSLDVSTDGGSSTTDISPSGVSTPFTPGGFAMDPVDEKHLVTGADIVTETAAGPATTTDPVTGASDWKTVFTFPKTATGGQPLLTTVDVLGSAVYASACSVCYSSVKLAEKSLDRTIATNVKPGCTPKTGATDCWHTVALAGFPVREIAALAIDPDDINTVYAATVIPSVIRYDFGDKDRVLVSHDAGQTWTDASGDLPQGNAWDVKVAGGKVYAAHDTGVFRADVSGAGAGHWLRLGSGLPESRVDGLALSSDRAELVAATYGSGVWTTSIPTGPAPLPADIRQTTKHPKKHAVKPPAGTLAATGLPGLLAVVGGLLVGVGLLVGRRRDQRV